MLNSPFLIVVVYVSSVDTLRQHLVNVLKPVAESFDIAFSAFDDAVNASGDRFVVSNAWSAPLEPAPRTPTDPHAKPYALLAATVKAVEQRNDPHKHVVVAPAMTTVNTGTLFLAC